MLLCNTSLVSVQLKVAKSVYLFVHDPIPCFSVKWCAVCNAWLMCISLHELGNQLRKALTELLFPALKETSVHASKNSSFSPKINKSQSSILYIMFGLGQTNKLLKELLAWNQSGLSMFRHLHSSLWLSWQGPMALLLLEPWAQRQAVEPSQLQGLWTWAKLGYGLIYGFLREIFTQLKPSAPYLAKWYKDIDSPSLGMGLGWAIGKT